jgi:hypothetical protein
VVVFSGQRKLEKVRAYAGYDFEETSLERWEEWDPPHAEGEEGKEPEE